MIPRMILMSLNSEYSIYKTNSTVIAFNILATTVPYVAGHFLLLAVNSSPQDPENHDDTIGHSLDDLRTLDVEIVNACKQQLESGDSQGLVSKCHGNSYSARRLR